MESPDGKTLHFRSAMRACRIKTGGFLGFNYPTASSSTSSTSIMCRVRQVRNVYKCGHGITQPDEPIMCASPRCRFSPAHPPDCYPPRCKTTCAQYRAAPEQYSPHIDSICPYCYTAARKNAGYPY